MSQLSGGVPTIPVVATEAELKRWGQVLDQIVIPYDAKHSGVRMLVESGKALPNTQPWRVIGLAVIYQPAALT
jgi:hypothetical protein